MEGFSVVEMWHAMGLLTKLNAIFMLILGIYSVAVIIERAVRYMNGSKESFAFVMSLRDHLAKGQVEQAEAAAKRCNWSPIGKVMHAGLSEYRAGMKALQSPGPSDVGHFDLVDAVNRSLERVKDRETTNLRKGLGGLATVASAAPFIGLFGTVVGIINAFEKLKGGGGMDVIGPGIAEALISTAVGLAIAIPAAMFFNFYTGIVERNVVDMNDVSSEFVDYVLKEGRAK